MKPNLKISLIAMVACVLIFALASCNGGTTNNTPEVKEPLEGLEFTLNDDGESYCLCGIGTCTDTDIMIPDTYNGKPVTSIGGWVFEHCTSLTSVTIPDSVTSIGESAFYKCTSLTSITIPDSVTSIGDHAFSDCNSLEYNKYDNAHYLGNSSNPYLVLVKAKSQDITSCNINSNTRFIHSKAFNSCTSLTSVTIPDSVTSIGDSAFSACYSLYKIINKSNLELTFGSSDNGEIAYHAKMIEDAEGNKIYKTDSDGTTYFEANDDFLFEVKNGKYTLIAYLGSNEAITLPRDINGESYSISNFNGNMKRVTIPDSVTSIGYRAFYDCKSLTSVTIPDSITSIGYAAFGGCTSLTNITIGNGVTSIGECAFDGCTLLTSVVIPNSVTSIDRYAFRGCTSLTSVTIPDSVTSIGNYAFYGCKSLKNITVDENNENYKSIDGNLYTKDGKTLVQYAIGKKDTSFAIPNGVTSIGGSAFEDCTLLTSITIPDSVTSIGDHVFSDCTSLETVYWNTTACTEAGSYYYPIFKNCTSLKTVVIGDNVTMIPNFAFNSCTSLTSVTIPDSVTSIGQWAFYACTSMTEIHYSGTTTQWNSINKRHNWDSDTGEYTIHCTDGEITK